MDVGVIGTGAMGSGIAANLVKAGHQVRVWDRTPEKARKLVEQGALRVERPQDAFGGDAVVTMLASDEATRAVLIEPGVLTHVKNTVHIISATISVGFAKELEALHEREKVPYVAAPVLGRPDLAQQGQLNVLVAGEQGSIEKIKPVLEAFGSKIWPIGRHPHQANAVKLACNFMLAAAIEAMAEASVLVERHDVKPSTLIEIVTGSLFAAPAYKTYGPAVAAHKFEPAGFALAHGLKDMRLAMAAAEAAATPMPFAAILHDNLVDALAHGGEMKDWSAMAEVSWRRAGLMAEVKSG